MTEAQGIGASSRRERGRSRRSGSRAAAGRDGPPMAQLGQDVVEELLRDRVGLRDAGDLGERARLDPGRCRIGHTSLCSSALFVLDVRPGESEFDTPLRIRSMHSKLIDLVKKQASIATRPNSERPCPSGTSPMSALRESRRSPEDDVDLVAVVAELRALRTACQTRRYRGAPPPLPSREIVIEVVEDIVSRALSPPFRTRGPGAERRRRLHSARPRNGPSDHLHHQIELELSLAKEWKGDAPDQLCAPGWRRRSRRSRPRCRKFAPDRQRPPGGLRGRPVGQAFPRSCSAIPA